MKNILLGILLGLTIVAGWLFYPNILNVFKSSAPQLAEKTTTIIRNKIDTKEIPFSSEKDELSTFGVSAKNDEKKEASSQPGLKGDEGTYTSIKETDYETVSQKETTDKIVEPYYAKEESLWHELIKKPLKPEYVPDYPYVQCFKTAASETNLPLSVILGLASYLSNFEPESSMDNKVGIMHMGWPNPLKEMGTHKKEEFMDNPCKNIKLACRFLSDLLSKSRGEWVPALVAYRDQVDVVHPEKIKKTDLLFSSKLRKHVEEVIQKPFKKKIMYAFWEFDKQIIAEEFMESIRKGSGVDLWLGQEGHRYIVYITAVDEQGKREKAELIKRETGIVGK
jgi:hypothetical protein